MKKASLAGLLVAGFAFSTAAHAESGADLFTKGTCNTCHNPAADTTGPAIKNISAAYKGKEAELVAFLNGSNKPKLQAGRFAGMYDAIMKGNVDTITKKWTADQRAAVAKYILGQ